MKRTTASWALLVVLCGFPARASESRAGAVRFEHVTRPEGDYEVAWVDPTRARIKLRWKGADDVPLETLMAARAATEAEGRRFRFATNAGMYAKSLAPLGLYVEGGRRLVKANRSHASKGNFFLAPNGVFSVTGTGSGVSAAVRETSAFLNAKAAPDFASQSGPMLVVDGALHPAFSKGSPNRKFRSGVGVDGAGRVAFAISTAPVNFYDFGLLFRDALACANALYLDGTISSFLEDKGASVQAAAFVGIWTVDEER